MQLALFVLHSARLQTQHNNTPHRRLQKGTASSNSQIAALLTAYYLLQCMYIPTWTFTYFVTLPQSIHISLETCPSTCVIFATNCMNVIIYVDVYFFFFFYNFDILNTKICFYFLCNKLQLKCCNIARLHYTSKFIAWIFWEEISLNNEVCFLSLLYRSYKEVGTYIVYKHINNHTLCWQPLRLIFSKEGH